MMRGAFADGQHIQKLRKSAAFTQEELAKRAGCDVKTIRKSEKGRRLDLSTLHQLAIALDVTSAEITQHTDSSQETEQANLQTVLEWLEAFNQRDVEGMLALWHDDGVRHIPGAENIPSGGSFHGKHQLREHLEESYRLFATEQIPRDRIEIHAADEFVFLRGNPSVVHIPSGQEMRCYAIHQFRFESGKIAEMLTTTDTHAFHRLVEGGDPAD